MCACVHTCVGVRSWVGSLLYPVSSWDWTLVIRMLGDRVSLLAEPLSCPSYMFSGLELYVPWWHSCYICDEPAHLCGHIVRTSVDLGWPLQVAGAHFTLMCNITRGAFWLVSFTDALGSWSFNAVIHMVVFEICWLVSYLCALVLLSCFPSSFLLLLNLIFSPKQKFGTL